MFFCQMNMKWLAMKLQSFNILVWFRYIYRGEQESDFEVHTLHSENVQEAVNKASDLYKNLRVIPFEYSHNGQKYAPNNFDKKLLVNQ